VPYGTFAHNTPSSDGTGYLDAHICRSLPRYRATPAAPPFAGCKSPGCKSPYANCFRLFISETEQEVNVTTQDTKSADSLAQQRTDLAVHRTMMAADRSLMAWIRTALSMISFGFTIYKILQGFQESGARLPSDYTPRNIGLFLIGLGTVSTVIGTIAYWQTFKELRVVKYFPVWRPSFVIALIMSGFGLFLFVGIVVRVL
jgi:putative membrane protein